MDELTKEEKEISRAASAKLGFGVLVFLDGAWICEPLEKGKKIGTGDTADEAIADCQQENK